MSCLWAISSRAGPSLLVDHFMLDLDWSEGCPSCSSVVDRVRVSLEHHHVAFAAVSRAPIEKLNAYKQRMGWSFPWVWRGR